MSNLPSSELKKVKAARKRYGTITSVTRLLVQVRSLTATSPDDYWLRNNLKLPFYSMYVDIGSLTMSSFVPFRYASLYFCAAIEQDDNELITLEIIHRYVELLDKYFGSVSTDFAFPNSAAILRLCSSWIRLSCMLRIWCLRFSSLGLA